MVYVHNPAYKQRQAKKFSYQYKGPYEIKQRISPLIYKIQLTDGTFAIIHINRLKHGCGLTGSNKVVLGKGKAKEKVKLHQGKGDIYESMLTSRIGRNQM